MNSASVYLATQVVASSPVERVVLLYRGAIRFATAHLEAVARGDQPAAHTASIRAQEIVGALRESLDMQAGAVANQLDALYDFCLRRLTDGNIRKDPRPTRDAITVLTGLLEAWQELAGTNAAGGGQPLTTPPADPAGPPARPAPRAGTGAAYGIIR